MRVVRKCEGAGRRHKHQGHAVGVRRGTGGRGEEGRTTRARIRKGNMKRVVEGEGRCQCEQKDRIIGG
jgi:hypothetical protein